MPWGGARPDPDTWSAENARLDADAVVEGLYAAHWRQLVRLAVLLIGDLGIAEEVVQDAFVAVHGRWGRIRDPEKALAYLRQAVLNRSRSALRHRSVVERHAIREAGREMSGPGADETALAAARCVAVIAALRRLPRRQREVLALRYYLDLSEAEIADALCISPGTVKSHASRGATALRRHLEDLR